MAKEDFGVAVDAVLLAPKPAMHSPRRIHLPPHSVGLEQFVIDDARAIEGLVGRLGHTTQRHWLEFEGLKQINRPGDGASFIDMCLTAGQGEHIESVDGCSLPQQRQCVKPGTNQSKRLDWVGQQKGPGPTFGPKDCQPRAGVFPESPVRGQLVEGSEQVVDLVAAAGERQCHLE